MNEKGRLAPPFSISIPRRCLEEQDEDDDDENQCEKTATDVHESPLSWVSLLERFSRLTGFAKPLRVETHKPVSSNKKGDPGAALFGLVPPA